MAAHSGTVTEDEPVGFISPHLDDVVLSCAGAITPESVVVTVFASGPRPVVALPDWDARCGFNDGDDVTMVRRLEDTTALGRFGASAQHLDFWPKQYRVPPAKPSRWPQRLISRLVPTSEPDPDPQTVDDVVSALTPVLLNSDLTTWYGPVGVGHLDHRITSAAMLRMARAHPGLRWILYDDLPYARQQAHLLHAALRRIREAGYTLGPQAPSSQLPRAAKLSAVQCYRSQLRALGASVETALNGPEMYRLLELGG